MQSWLVGMDSLRLGGFAPHQACGRRSLLRVDLGKDGREGPHPHVRGGPGGPRWLPPTVSPAELQEKIAKLRARIEKDTIKKLRDIMNDPDLKWLPSPVHALVAAKSGASGRLTHGSRTSC